MTNMTSESGRVCRRGALSVLLFLLPAVIHALAQTAPVIVAAHDRDVTVDGTADPDAGPVTILDISYEAETPIGSGEVSAAGRFGIAVSPALVRGNRLVAVDKQGRRSAPFVVAAARSGPVPSGPN